MANETEMIEINKEQFDVVCEILPELKDVKCGVCGVKITRDNYGFLAKDSYSCNNFGCQVIVMAEFEASKRGGDLK
jgi:hypothetical protein